MQTVVVIDETIKAGQLGAFMDYMREMIRLTKAEDGCIAYDFYEAQDGSGEVVLVEIWESSEALDLHLQTEHFKEFFSGADIFRERPSKVRVFSRL